MASSCCSRECRIRAGRLRRRLEGLQHGGGDDAALLKALTALQRLSERCEEAGPKQEAGPSAEEVGPEQEAWPSAEEAECLALYTQALLDVTYCEESRLVEAEFPGDDSLQTVRDLERLLSELEHPQQNVVLDPEVQECLHWRRGALLYMYCHTVGERESWALQHPETFHQCLEDGVHYLLKLLHTRSPVQLDDKVICQDVNTAALLEKGIFSDVHVLALMYCGEMCYWAQRYCREAAQTSQRREDPETSSKGFHFREIGQKVLDTYVAVCEGPLRGQGWSTDNAKKILQYLKGAV
ncbi:RAB7A-interacting MON1-CCZ1 complex subunit 1 [Anomaloglossus baeobatrachus]|uniref:RAB7A-interacting MON1-CCZ1 complex subunit 1 n=1 Tax=Anomaloglossus baeobatrachus TaxID=238106 RepID=UPI003F4F6581